MTTGFSAFEPVWDTAVPLEVPFTDTEGDAGGGIPVCDRFEPV